MTTEDGYPPSEATPPSPDAPTQSWTAAPEEPTSERPPPTSRPPTVLPRTPRRHGSRPSRRSRAKKRSFLRELPGIVITALVISVLIKTFLVQAFYIPTGSMENTLLVNDRVLVNKLADKPDEIHRGDVVVFRDPGGWLGSSEKTDQRGGIIGTIRKGLVFVGLAPAVGEEDLIKRVIGVGGDTVQCCTDDHLTVNGVPLDEPYLYPGDLGHPSANNFGPVHVPEGELWVMGDHRSVSEDSRAHREQKGGGFLPVKDVIGRAFTIVWPVNRAKLLHPPGTFQQPGLAHSGS